MWCNIINLLLGIPKSIIINFKYFPIKDAIKFPILVSGNTILKKVSGRVIIKEKITPFMIKLGFSSVGIIDIARERSIWEVDGIINFRGGAFLGSGSKLSIGGYLDIGNDVKITAKASIYCKKRIVIGDRCLISWDNLIMDTDSHKIYDNQKNLINDDKSIIIGENNWIGCRCTLLKGTKIGNNNVLAANTVMSKEILEDNCLIAGIPAKKIKDNIVWSK